MWSPFPQTRFSSASASRVASGATSPDTGFVPGGWTSPKSGAVVARGLSPRLAVNENAASSALPASSEPMVYPALDTLTLSSASTSYSHAVGSGVTTPTAPGLDLECVHGCGTLLPAAEWATHVAQSCPRVPTLCVYGCGQALPRGEQNLHAQQDVLSHLRHLTVALAEAQRTIDGLTQRLQKIDAASDKPRYHSNTFGVPPNAAHPYPQWLCCGARDPTAKGCTDASILPPSPALCRVERLSELYLLPDDEAMSFTVIVCDVQGRPVASPPIDLLRVTMVSDEEGPAPRAESSTGGASAPLASLPVAISSDPLWPGVFHIAARPPQGSYLITVSVADQTIPGMRNRFCLQSCVLSQFFVIPTNTIDTLHSHYY